MVHQNLAKEVNHYRKTLREEWAVILQNNLIIVFSARLHTNSLEIYTVCHLSRVLKNDYSQTFDNNFEVTSAVFRILLQPGEQMAAIVEIIVDKWREKKRNNKTNNAIKSDSWQTTLYTKAVYYRYPYFAHQYALEIFHPIFFFFFTQNIRTTIFAVMASLCSNINFRIFKGTSNVDQILRGF